MADAPEVVTEDAVSTPDPGSSESNSALSPEELRDVETFARHGMNPDGSPLQQQPETPAKPDEKTDPVVDPVDASKEVDKSTAATDPEDEDADEAELTDEQVDRYVDSLLELAPDKLANNPKIRERIEQEIREKLETENEAKQRTQSASQEREQLTRQGRAAVEAVFGQLKVAEDGFTKAKTELDKAFKGEPFDEKVLTEGFSLDPKKFEQDMGTFAAAAVADSRRSYDDAFSSGFKAATTVGGPITEAERDAIVSIVNTANRIEADEKQGEGRFDKAKMHLYTETWKLTTTRAFEAGKAAALVEAKAKRDARKTVLDSDAVLAGAAKEAKTRAGMPPPPVAPTGAATTGSEATMEAYQAAKRAGNHDLADDIMQRMQATAPLEAQRRLQR